MCDKHLFGGPLVCLETGRDEHDGHTHRYETTDGSSAGPEKDHG